MPEEIFNKYPWYKKIEILRVANGWGQRQAGEKCLTSRKNYWQWEKGKCYPRPSNRRLIARAFGLKVEHIFTCNDKTIRDVIKM